MSANYSDSKLLELGRDLQIMMEIDKRLKPTVTHDTWSALAIQEIKLVKAIHRLRPTTLEGVGVKLTAIAFDLADFHVERIGCGDVAEIQVARLSKQVNDLVRASA